MSCENCTAPAALLYQWPTSQGPQSARLCLDCAGKWWAEYRHTPSGQGLTIRDVEPET